MPKFKVDRTIYYAQGATDIVEADTPEEAVNKVEREDPEFNWEHVWRARTFDRIPKVTEVEGPSELGIHA